jgi:hypothetical protein
MVFGWAGSSATSSHVTTTFGIPDNVGRPKWNRLSNGSTGLSGTRIALSLEAAISTPFFEHHAYVVLLGWAAIGLPHPAGWTRRGRTIPRDAHGVEWPFVAAIEVVAAVVQIPTIEIVRKTRRNMATLHYVIPLASTWLRAEPRK